MSDYIYMLESRLTPEQNQAVAAVQTAAVEAGLNVFLTGGAMRDVLGGYPIRDLDFAVEGNAMKVAKGVCSAARARQATVDELRKSVELEFPTGVTAQIAMTRQEKTSRAGAKPQISQATIQEDLRGRDFTCNAIALSLNKASRGLLLDPLNGLADIERRELRAAGPYGFYDDPSRLLRAVRFCVRFGFAVEERTQLQMANAREAGVESLIPPRALGDELVRISVEDSPGEVIQALADAGMLPLFSPSLAGAKLNSAGLGRFEKLVRALPGAANWRAARMGPFFYALTEKFTPKEKLALIRGVALTKGEVDIWQKLEPRARKLETALRSPRIRKPSHVYRLVSEAPPDEIIYLLYHSAVKPVRERLRNYFQKYLPAVEEITPEEWAALEGAPGTPKNNKAREAFLTNRLDRRPPKAPAPEGAPEAEPEEQPAPRRGR